jgi:hypothetical protein
MRGGSSSPHSSSDSPLLDRLLFGCFRLLFAAQSEGFPALFAQALSGLHAPLHAGRHALLMDDAAATATLDPDLVREHLHLVATIGAFVK